MGYKLLVIITWYGRYGSLLRVTPDPQCSDIALFLRRGRRSPLNGLK